MTAAALLCELAARGIELLPAGDDRIRLRAAADSLTDALVERVRQHKPALLAALRDLPYCCECRQPITEPVTTWWGGEPVHRACGEAVWYREWQR